MNRYLTPMRCAALAATFLLTGCAPKDQLTASIERMDRLPPEKRVPNWEQTRRLLLRPAPHVGDIAPDFTLPTLDGSTTVTRSVYQSQRPLVLMFGNYTCPPFRRASVDVQRLYQEYGDRAAFLFVYVREAHPSDEWQMEPNVKDGVVYAQPKDLSQRRDIAQTCCKSLAITMPCVVDSIDNHVDEMYAGWPERLFVIDEQGRIAFACGQGPFGFDPPGLEAWLKRRFDETGKAGS